MVFEVGFLLEWDLSFESGIIGLFGAGGLFFKVAMGFIGN